MGQLAFQKINWKHRHNHGGILRQQRRGRKSRPLSTKQTIHLVFKANKETLRGGFRTRRRFILTHFILKKYAKRFWIRIDQISIQFDHIHLLIRAPRRAKYLDFFRVVAGQIAQRFQKEGLVSLAVTGTQKTGRRNGVTGTRNPTPSDEKMRVKLWKYRPFTRVVVGHRAYERARSYVLLNELEAIGKIPYRKERLRGLSLAEWQLVLQMV